MDGIGQRQKTAFYFFIIIRYREDVSVVGYFWIKDQVWTSLLQSGYF